MLSKKLILPLLLGNNLYFESLIATLLFKNAVHLNDICIKNWLNVWLNVRVLVGLAARAYELLHNTQEEGVI